MIFQTELSTLDTELSKLEALLDAKRQQRSLFEELDAETNVAIEMVALLKTKIEAVSSDAIASLKTAVLKLFTDGGNNGGNQPADPTPDPDDDEPELLCLNGLTGECLTTADHEELPADNPVGDEWVLPSSTALTGQTCDINPDLYWENNAPDGSCWEFASLYACGVWDDAPLTGQHCTITLSTTTDKEDKGTEVDETMPQRSSTEMVHTSARTGYLKLKTNGQILATYAWFPRKDLAESWFDWFDGMSLGSPELRKSQRNSSWKYEIKFTGLSMTQIERLTSEDLSRKPSKKKETLAQSLGLESPSGWRQPQSKEDSPQLNALVLLPESEYVGQTFPVSRVSANGIGYTVTLPNGDSRWYRADMVQIVDAEIEENALPTEPTQPEDEGVQMAQNRQEAEAIAFEFGDIAEVIADLNGTHLIGSFGKVKFVKDNRIALEIDEQLAYFQPEELSLKAKAEVPQQQQQQSGQVLLGNRIVTNGNYFGAARRTAIANARRGTANKIAALELVKAGLSPELAMAAATGTDDDASDF